MFLPLMVLDSMLHVPFFSIRRGRVRVVLTFVVLANLTLAFCFSVGTCVVVIVSDILPSVTGRKRGFLGVVPGIGKHSQLIVRPLQVKLCAPSLSLVLHITYFEIMAVVCFASLHTLRFSAHDTTVIRRVVLALIYIR